MKITKIRDKKTGKKLTPYELATITEAIYAKLTCAGFITGARLNGSAIHIGLHMCAFRINPEHHGYNRDFGYFGSRCKAGSKRTTIPTWEQREEFNHIINNVLDKFGVRANAYNSVLSIRTFEDGRINSWNHCTMANGERFYYEIRSEKELAKEARDERRIAKLRANAQQLEAV